MRALVIANGERVSLGLLRQLAGESDFVVAADGGFHHARAAGLIVDAVVGDLDSLAEEDYRELGPGTVFRQADPDSTDLEKAVAHALARGAEQVAVTCAGGGRADHALANLSILVKNRGRGDLRVVDDRFETMLVDGRVELDDVPGTVVSLVSIGTCTGVTTTGMRWNLRDHTLEFSPYGVHNEIAHPPATVSVKSGDLLLFRGRWVERHGRLG